MTADIEIDEAATRRPHLGQVNFTILQVRGARDCKDIDDCWIEISGSLQNHTDKRISDVVISCEHLDNSGHPIPVSFLDRNGEIIYDAVKPDDSLKVSFYLSDAENSKTLRCQAKEWAVIP